MANAMAENNGGGNQKMLSGNIYQSINENKYGLLILAEG